MKLIRHLTKPLACKAAGSLLFGLCALGLSQPAANAAITAVPAATSLPDLVVEPAVNLGLSSFYDGFADPKPGFVFVDYGRYEDLTSISSSKGTEVPVFKDPHIQAFVDVLQGVWRTPLHTDSGRFIVTALLPLVDLNSSFGHGPGTLQLHSNGFGVGDLVWGPGFNAFPIKLFGHPFAWRAEIDTISPIGAFNKHKDLNQSSGFWSLNPFVAFTYLPAKGWEVSGRLNYIYNFTSTNIPNPPPIPHVHFVNGQAGQAAWLNFAASKRIFPGFSLGINGYYFQQLTDDRINNIALAHSRKNQLYIGPGFNWKMNVQNILNVNLYLPVTTHGEATGPQVNFQYIHLF